MTQEHPITPPEEVINEWESEWHHHQGQDTYEVFMAKQAAQWGADQQLEQDARWLDTCALFSAHLTITPSGDALREAMRPKQTSLKEQALALISHDPENQPFLSEKGIAIIRRALEQLDD